MYQKKGDEELNKLLQSFKSNPISMNTEHRFRINHTVKVINILCNISDSLKIFLKHFKENHALDWNMSDTFWFQRNGSIVFWVSKDHLWHYCFKSKERVIRYRSSTGKVFFLVRKKLATVSPYCSGGEWEFFKMGLVGDIQKCQWNRKGREVVKRE